MDFVNGQIERWRRTWTTGDTGIILGVFTATLFVSAVLLFSVQPMFAKMVLPKLGGSPSVWAVSMCFFQAVLLAGYCYAHMLSRYLPLRWIPVVHLALLALAMFALPIGLSESRAEPPAGDAYGWLIVTLGLGVGLPFFAVSANAPLLQAWFARTGHPHASDPYFLYGASNLGSLIALLAYPVAIEPFTGLAHQATIWAAGFMALAAMIAVCGVVMVGAVQDRDDSADDTIAPHLDARPLTIAQRASWVALAFVPSGLLVAFTSYVTTDIASAPFLWVIPLAMFLGTFILVFRDRPYIPHRWMLHAQPVLTIVVIFGLSMVGSAGWQIASLGGTLAFFVATMVCHRELFERRPASRHLTEFYLWMSFGGVLGGVFAALIAPQIFDAIWEYPLLLILAMACRPGIAARVDGKEARKLFVIVVLAVAAMLLIASLHRHGVLDLGVSNILRTLLMLGFGSLALLRRGKTVRQLVFTAIAATTLALLVSPMNRGDAVRSFFGTHRVTTSSDGSMRLLLHGTTLHGAERLLDKDGSPFDRPVPATYYHSESPLVLGVEAARANHKGPKPFRGGVVGLGAGAMACTSRPGEAWRFYEIDPVVVQIAADPKRFRFLSMCQPNADIVMGDARLTLTKEPDGVFDFLHLDAFSSDSIPVHLMTVEAIRMYLDKLTPNGLLMMHISNRHLALAPVVAAAADAIPGTHTAHVISDVRGHGMDRVGSEVMFITKTQAALEPVLRLNGARSVKSTGWKPWTDDYSDILTALWHKYRG
jgi:hypothetical protein